MVVSVYLDLNSMTLAYKPQIRQARWRTGFISMEKLCNDADAQLKVDKYDFDFVDKMT